MDNRKIYRYRLCDAVVFYVFLLSILLTYRFRLMILRLCESRVSEQISDTEYLGELRLHCRLPLRMRQIVGVF